MNANGKEMVLTTLRNATSQDPAILKPAEDQLRAWEKEPGLYPTLTQALVDHSIDEHSRWMAVLYLKHGIDRYWRKTAPYALPDEEKNLIRQWLLQSFSEPVPQIAVQVSVVISRLARLDFPKQWPELFPAIFENVQSPELLLHQRAMLTLHHVVKQLASKRLIADRKVFQELTPQIFGYLLDIWRNQSSILCTLDPNSNEFSVCLNRARMSMKVLRRLCVHGYKDPSSHLEVDSFIKGIFEQIRPLAVFYKNVPQNSDDHEFMGKLIVTHLKVLLDFLENHPLSFLNYLQASLELSCFYAFTKEGKEYQFTKLLLSCFTLAKAILTCREYRPGRASVEPNETVATACSMKEGFFSQQVVTHMINVLISHYFLLNEDSLRSWDSDSEEFFLEEHDNEGAHEASKYTMKPCVENFFVCLLTDFTPFVIAAVESMISSSKTMVSPEDVAALAQKDAIYNAAGLASFELFETIDFTKWVQEILITELKVTHPNYRILRRRVIWLISRWSSIMREDAALRPLIYEAVIHLLSQEEDLVVKLTAANALKTVIDDFDFSPEQFSQYLPSSFSLLLNLLRSVQECETKMHVLLVMSTLIDYVGECVKAHVKPLLGYLPQLWAESQDSDMLRCSILTLLTGLVAAVQTESQALQEFLSSLIAFSTDTTQKGYIYLVEDALQLWSAVVENASSASKPLLDVYENAFALLEETSENLTVCLNITKAYIVLAPEQFLARYGERIVKISLYMVTDLKDDGILEILKMLETMLKVMPLQAAAILTPIFSYTVKILLQTGPISINMAISMCFMARLVLYADDKFAETIDRVATECGKPAEMFFEEVLDAWEQKLCRVAPIERQKLCALGLSKLCGTDFPAVLKHWSVAVTAVAEVIFDLASDEGADDRLVIGKDELSLDDESYCTEHSNRLGALLMKEVVHTLSLREFLGQKVKDFERKVGSAVVAELFENLELDCKQLLRDITAS